MKPNVIKGIVVAVLLVAAAVLFWWQLQPDAETRAAIARGRENRGEPAKPAAGQSAPAAGNAPAPAAAPAGQESQLDLDALLASVQQVEFEYAANRPSRDPMRALVGLRPAPTPPDGEGEEDKLPPSPIPPSIRSMILSGIVYDEQRPMAVLDDEVVFPGYEFPNGVVVEAIEPTAVRLRMGDREFTLNYEEL
jgi:hypothetical protein